MVSKKVTERPYLCKTSGVVGKNAICGSVSVYKDTNGYHKCMANGNFKCGLKIDIRNVKK